MEMAKQACDLLETQSDLAVQYALLRDLVVTYARPFSTNRGRTHKRHKLREEIVPAEMNPLHSELMTLRDQSFAHTDHDFRKPQIARWPRKGGGATYGMGFANPPYQSLLARLAEIRQLTVVVEAAINARARAFELEFNQLYPEEAAEQPPEEFKPPGV